MAPQQCEIQQFPLCVSRECIAVLWESTRLEFLTKMVLKCIQREGKQGQNMFSLNWEIRNHRLYIYTFLWIPSKVCLLNIIIATRARFVFPIHESSSLSALQLVAWWFAMICHFSQFEFSVIISEKRLSVVQEQINLIILEPIPDDASECLQFSDETWRRREVYIWDAASVCAFVWAENQLKFCSLNYIKLNCLQSICWIVVGKP